MKTQKVSVIIPCYNQGHFVTQAIDCVINQTYPDVEVVVVNDGSADSTEEAVGAYGSRINYVYQANSGLSAARNTGIRNSSGDFFLFLDSDDLIDSRTIEFLVSAACNYGFDLVQCGWKTFHHIGDLNEQSGFPGCKQPLMPLLIGQNAGPVHSFLVKKSLVDRVGGFELGLNSCEDWDFWVRCVHEGAVFGSIEDAFAFYRETPNSMSKNLCRMLIARTNVFFRTWDLFEYNSERYKFGSVFAEVACRLRRRFLAQRLNPESRMYARLCDISKDLERNGIRALYEGKQRVLSAILPGTALDKLMVLYYRYFDRKTFDYYADRFY